DHVHEQFRAQGLSGRALIEATSGIANGLQDLMEPTLLYFHRRAWARAAQDDFLRHLTEDSRPLPSSPGARTCTVMFADLSGFTPLTAAMGDDAAAEVLSRFGDAVRRLTTQHHGRVVKQIGDAFMVVFDDRLGAVSCGLSLLTWCNAESRFPPVHIGAHAGEVLFREGDFIGAAVNLAARVASVTEPAQFLVTSDVLSGWELPDGMLVVEHGPRALKGLHLPVELVAISSAGAPLGGDAADPVCGMKIGALDADLQQEWGGRTYLFCSLACAEQFMADPRRYAHPALR
ncbi:MAG: adenylate/guanylate cyclase domain-containing protein, partial [Mycobacteriales bacterium]